MMKKLKFEELNLSKDILRAVADLGFEEATPIQSEAIPPILTGKDIIGQAMTGTGKTAAFGIPVAEKIDAHNNHVQAIILCPTRELAIQVTVEINKFLKYKRQIIAVPVYGGQPIERQFQALRRGAHIVVGTPGRVMDHLDRGTLKMDHVAMVVLDEADRMLDMGFRDDIEVILGQTPAERQTLLFSATMPQEIMHLARRYQNDPQTIKISHEKVTVPEIEQIYFEVDGRMKLELLARLIDIHNPSSAVVFCNTKRKVDDVVSGLIDRGYTADGIHGDITQPKRDRVMGKFRKGSVDILVATDVAARGIDVPDVEAVFNFDIPQDEESYVHRIGRTGRAGKAGKAFSFVSGREMYEFRNIKRFTHAHIVQQPLPSLVDIEAHKANKVMTTIKNSIQDGNLERYTQIVEKLMEEEFTSVDIAAALLKILAGNKKEQHKEDILLLSAQQKKESYNDEPRSNDRGGSRFRSRRPRGRRPSWYRS